VKLSGSRHTVFINDGAKLLRALRNFTLDLHAEAGFNEVQPPVILNAEPLYGTGNLPKYEEDLFKLNNGQYLSPTEEIPLTALYMNETLNYNSLPIKLTSSTLNFRSEVGSAGRDQKGIIRQYQFYNTEMIIFSKPNESESLHEEMTHEAEKVLQELGLSYRVILLCTGDMGASAVKTYDIEV
jgi:seryl-tRNA synthetase